MLIAPTSATTHLCIAAYVVPGFARRIVARVHRGSDARLRPFLPPAGIDFPAVFTHCVAAERTERIRDAVIAMLGILGLAAALVNLSLWWMALAASIVAVAIAAYLADRDGMRCAHAALLDVHSIEANQAACMAPALIETRDRLKRAQENTVVIHPGFSPFVGSGLDIGGWSLSVDVTRGTAAIGGRVEPQAVRIHTFYEMVAGALSKLHLEASTSQSSVHVGGQDVRHQSGTFDEENHTPCTALSSARLQQLMSEPDRKIRYYQMLRILAWEGEVALSVFFRFERSGPRLHAEAVYLLRPPVRPHFRRAVERLERDESIAERWLSGALVLMGAPLIWLRASWFTAMRVAVATTGRVRRHREMGRARRRPAYNFGAPQTALDAAISNEYSRYFQRRDAERYAELINAQVLDGLAETLEAHGIDTSSLEEKRTVIQNAGVIMTGGTIKAQALAVGRQAWATSLVPGRPRVPPASQTQGGGGADG